MTMNDMRRGRRLDNQERDEERNEARRNASHMKSLYKVYGHT